MTKDNAYLETITKIEPDIAMIDAGAGWASIAVSLKRIADALVKVEIYDPQIDMFRPVTQHDVDVQTAYIQAMANMFPADASAIHAKLKAEGKL